MKKLNCVLLVDDNEADNFLNKLIIKERDCAEKIVAVESGYDALDYLHSKESGEHPQPDIIFLDINMPGMNGFEFLEEYNKLPEDKKGRVVVVMLTTSMNPDDLKKAESMGLVSGFKNKPLSHDALNEILKHHFDM